MSDGTKRERWVREAVGITDALTTNGSGRYLCPLCLGWFSDVDDLSLEHAPPESVGGRQITVTCRHCNSTAGHTVDAELRWAETIRDFGSHRMTRPMSATFQFAGIEQRVEARFGPEGLSIAGVGKQNPPETAPAMTAAFEEFVSGSRKPTFKLSFRAPDFRKAAVGWLRTGYLVAFATLGYVYILREELEDVRRQIRDPMGQILDRFCVMFRNGPEDRRISFVRAPAEFESVTVFSNECAVFLPSDASTGTYERLAAIVPWPPGVQTLSGPSAPWPRRPTFRPRPRHSCLFQPRLSRCLATRPRARSSARTRSAPGRRSGIRPPRRPRARHPRREPYGADRPGLGSRTVHASRRSRPPP